MKKNNILVVGSNGQLGTDMVKLAAQYQLRCTGFDFPQIDITNKDSVSSVFKSIRPDVIINCAAFTAVDECEKRIPDAYKVNADGPAILAEISESFGSLLVHISTDFVFNGKKNTPYLESDTPSPESTYGKSKYQGELNVAKNTKNYQIYRIAWLYGVYGNNFVKAIRRIALSRAATGEPMKVVNDQIGTPTHSFDVCKQIFSTMNTDLFGIFHCTSEGFCTKFDFAKEILDRSGIKADLRPCTTEEYPSPAPRPKYSVLENSRLKAAGENLMPEWKEAFQSFLEREKKVNAN